MGEPRESKETHNCGEFGKSPAKNEAMSRTGAAALADTDDEHVEGQRVQSGALADSNFTNAISWRSQDVRGSQDGVGEATMCP